MPQHDYIIADQGGAAFLSDLNNMAAAMVALNAGVTEPATMYAYMPWADIANDKLKIRNAANTAWIELFTLSSAGWLGNAATVSVADAAADTTTWPMLARSQTGNQAPTTDAGLTYNASTNTLSAATFEGNATRLTDGTNNIKMKIINIGDWNMDTTATASVAHGLSVANIRSVSAHIRTDDGAELYPLDMTNSLGATNGRIYQINSTNVIMERFDASLFDGSVFNATSFNRGWIVITYVE